MVIHYIFPIYLLIAFSKIFVLDILLSLIFINFNQFESHQSSIYFKSKSSLLIFTKYTIAIICSFFVLHSRICLTKVSSTVRSLSIMKSSFFNHTSSFISLSKASSVVSQWSIFHQGKSYSPVKGHLHFFITTIFSLYFNIAYTQVLIDFI